MRGSKIQPSIESSGEKAMGYKNLLSTLTLSDRKRQVIIRRSFDKAKLIGYARASSTAMRPEFGSLVTEQ